MTPSAFQFAPAVTADAVHLPVTSDGGSFVLGAEVPVEEQSFTLRVTRHTLAIPPELRIVGREELEAGQGPLPELVDDSPVAEDTLDLPVGGQGTEVDDPHVPLGRLGLKLFR